MELRHGPSLVVIPSAFCFAETVLGDNADQEMTLREIKLTEVLGNGKCESLYMSSQGMASTIGLLSEKHFLCSLCEDIFSRPITTPCGHSFCKGCVRKYWSRTGSDKCPFCGKTFDSRPHLSVNRILADVTDQYRKSRSGSKARARSVEGALNEPVSKCLRTAILPQYMTV